MQNLQVCEEPTEYRGAGWETQQNTAVRNALEGALSDTAFMSQKIIFVSGKGGVGKSSVAGAIAMSFAESGKKTLLVELGDHSYFEIAWKLSPVAYKPLPVENNLDIALWSAQDCLREYALHLLKVERLYKLFFENPVMRTLINVAPALKELAILGKITSQPRKHGPPLDYDVLVVDAFATGHFLALLAAPVGMAQAVQFGPMGEQSRGIDQVIRNPEICSYVLVSLPEELPLQETLELQAKLTEKFSIQSSIVLNKVLQLSDKEVAAAKASDTDFAKMLNHHQMREQMAKKILTSIKSYLIAPWILKNSSREISTDLKTQLAKEFLKVGSSNEKESIT